MNASLDHLSRIEIGEEPKNIEYGLPDAQLFRVEMVDDYHEKIVPFLVTRRTPEGLTINQKKQLVVRPRNLHIGSGFR